MTEKYNIRDFLNTEPEFMQGKHKEMWYHLATKEVMERIFERSGGVVLGGTVYSPKKYKKVEQALDVEKYNFCSVIYGDTEIQRNCYACDYALKKLNRKNIKGWADLCAYCPIFKTEDMRCYDVNVKSPYYRYVMLLGSKKYSEASEIAKQIAEAVPLTEEIKVNTFDESKTEVIPEKEIVLEIEHR